MVGLITPGLLASPIAVLFALIAQAGSPAPAPVDWSKVAAPTHAVRAASLLIRDVMVVRGNGTPALGPTDVLVRGNRIESIEKWKGSEPPATVIDGKGRYLLPGLVNMHGHIQEASAGIAIENDYQFGLWLACGITSIRDLGSDFERSLVLREKSAKGEIACPRVVLYPFLNSTTPEALKLQVRELKNRGAEGLKIFTMDRDCLEAVLATAHELGLRCTTHMGVEETNAWDCCRLGMTSIEHWYGIPDAAMNGTQHFPPEFSYSNEVDRFRYAGRIWREADPEKLERVLKAMVDAKVAWDPTLAIYEASRDMTRAQNQPWFKEHLHPALEKFFTPNLENHGSFFIGWTSTDEAFWRENYRIWMKAVRRFADLGGTITCGEDGGFIYEMYGFGYLRELELHEEAGFQPLEVITQATNNAAKVLGKETEIGRIRAGYLADLVLVNGNPLSNLRLLYPTGADVYVDGKPVHTGGIEWTVKDGIPYHGPTLMQRVRDIVRRDRAQPPPAVPTTGGAHAGGAGAHAGGAGANRCCAGASAGG